jgi:hypothetical protein
VVPPIYATDLLAQRYHVTPQEVEAMPARYQIRGRLFMRFEAEAADTKRKP